MAKCLHTTCIEENMIGQVWIGFMLHARFWPSLHCFHSSSVRYQHWIENPILSVSFNIAVNYTHQLQ